MLAYKETNQPVHKLGKISVKYLAIISSNWELHSSTKQNGLFHRKKLKRSNHISSSSSIHQSGLSNCAEPINSQILILSFAPTSKRWSSQCHFGELEGEDPQDKRSWKLLGTYSKIPQPSQRAMSSKGS